MNEWFGTTGFSEQVQTFLVVSQSLRKHAHAIYKGYIAL